MDFDDLAELFNLKADSPRSVRIDEERSGTREVFTTPNRSAIRDRKIIIKEENEKHQDNVPIKESGGASRKTPKRRAKILKPPEQPKKTMLTRNQRKKMGIANEEDGDDNEQIQIQENEEKDLSDSSSSSAESSGDEWNYPKKFKMCQDDEDEESKKASPKIDAITKPTNFAEHPEILKEPPETMPTLELSRKSTKLNPRPKIDAIIKPTNFAEHPEILMDPPETMPTFELSRKSTKLNSRPKIDAIIKPTNFAEHPEILKEPPGMMAKFELSRKSTKIEQLEQHAGAVSDKNVATSSGSKTDPTILDLQILDSEPNENLPKMSQRRKIDAFVCSQKLFCDPKTKKLLSKEVRQMKFEDFIKKNPLRIDYAKIEDEAEYAPCDFTKNLCLAIGLIGRVENERERRRKVRSEPIQNAQEILNPISFNSSYLNGNFKVYTPRGFEIDAAAPFDNFFVKNVQSADIDELSQKYFEHFMKLFRKDVYYFLYALPTDSDNTTYVPLSTDFIDKPVSAIMIALNLKDQKFEMYKSRITTKFTEKIRNCLINGRSRTDKNIDIPLLLQNFKDVLQKREGRQVQAQEVQALQFQAEEDQARNV